MNYLDTIYNVYKGVAITPNIELCCTTNPIWDLSGLKIPKIMQEMNYGDEPFLGDKKGHILLKNQPLAVCDKTALLLKNLKRDDIFISESTFHYHGRGCY